MLQIYFSRLLIWLLKKFDMVFSRVLMSVVMMVVVRLMKMEILVFLMILVSMLWFRWLLLSGRVLVCGVFLVLKVLVCLVYLVQCGVSGLMFDRLMLGFLGVVMMLVFLGGCGFSSVGGVLGMLIFFCQFEVMRLVVVSSISMRKRLIMIMQVMLMWLVLSWCQDVVQMLLEEEDRMVFILG